MNAITRLLVICMIVTLAGCGTRVLRAGFNEKSDGDKIGTGSVNYNPPENPSGDQIRGSFLTADNHGFTDSFGLSPSDDTALMIIPITPAQVGNALLDFRSKQVSSNHNKFTFAWSGKKKGNLVLNCVFGTQKSTTTESLEPDVIRLRFGDGKVFYFAGTQPHELGTLPNDVEHRVFVTARPVSNNYYLSIQNSESPELIHTGSIGALEFEDFDRIRAECNYEGTASPGTNRYVFDKMEFKSKKN